MMEVLSGQTVGSDTFDAYVMLHINVHITYVKMKKSLEISTV